MKRVRYAVAAVMVMSSLWVAAPSQATECDPKGCSSACHVNPPVGIDENGNVIMDGPLIECYA